MLGLSAWKSGDFATSEKAFDKALSLDPRHVKSLVNSSRLFIDQKRHEDAIDRLTRASELDPESLEVSRLLARTYVAQGKTEDAIEAYRRVIELNENDAWSLNNLGLLFLEAQKADEALPLFAKASELRKDVAAFHNNFGMALEHTGRFKAAAAAYTGALAADPGYEKAKLNLERVEAVKSGPEEPFEHRDRERCICEQVGNPNFRSWRVRHDAEHARAGSAWTKDLTMKLSARCIAIAVALCVLLAPLTAVAQDDPVSADKTLSPYFFVEGGDPALDRLPLKDTRVDVAIAGVIADVTVRQVYENRGARPLHARYIFPASTRAAVYGLTMVVGDVRTVARIRERKQAAREFEAAKSEGKSASLLEQSRPNVFSMQVANVLPGDTIVVELKYTELLVPTEGVYEFVYPTVVGPRYSSKRESQALPEDAFVKAPVYAAGRGTAQRVPSRRGGIQRRPGAGAGVTIPSTGRERQWQSTHRVGAG